MDAAMDGFMSMFVPAPRGGTDPAAARASDAKVILALIEANTHLLAQLGMCEGIKDPNNPGLSLGTTMGPFYRGAMQEILMAIRGTAMVIQTGSTRIELEQMMGEGREP
ncbi:hypothetical protein VZG28_05175 [Synechococcus elongatus IITB4]|uniref:hypothetical protein n=1 Tax=Synechococcus elongatus TaxID=32046 RepID=UPI0030CBA73D